MDITLQWDSSISSNSSRSPITLYKSGENKNKKGIEKESSKDPRSRGRDSHDQKELGSFEDARSPF